MTRQGPAPADDPKCVAEWRERVGRCRASGLKVAEFAKREGVKTKQMTWWMGELRRLEEGRPRRRGFAEVDAAPRFVALEVATMASVPPAATPIDVVLRSGLALRVTHDFDEATLRRLVSMLEGA